MGMRPYVEILGEQDVGGSRLVEENERADHLAMGGREDAPDGEAADVTRPRDDDGLDQVGGAPVAEGRIGNGQCAHDRAFRGMIDRAE